MHPDGIISAIVIGLLIGGLGRLLVPGRQAIGVIATVLIGLAAAFLGSWISYEAKFSFGVNLIVDVVLAAVGVALISGSLHGASRRSRLR